MHGAMATEADQADWRSGLVYRLVFYASTASSSLKISSDKHMPEFAICLDPAWGGGEGGAIAAVHPVLIPRTLRACRRKTS